MAGFLIADMHNKLQKTDDYFTKSQIREHQFMGIELQSYMFTIATTNMILRGDGKSNLENEDFFKTKSRQTSTKRLHCKDDEYSIFSRF